MTHPPPEQMPHAAPYDPDAAFVDAVVVPDFGPADPHPVDEGEQDTLEIESLPELAG